MSTEEELKNTRLAKAERLKDHGSQGWPNTLRVTPAMESDRREYVAVANSEERRAQLPTDRVEGGPELSFYGRVMAKRGPFLVLRTPYGDAQALVRKQALEEAAAAQLKMVDLGDHVLVRGQAIQTRSGDAALSAVHFEHVSKSTLPPPDKWHGLKDVEKRYRERYVDLFTNPDVATVFRARSVITRAIRSFLDERGYLEVETPQLHSLQTGAAARPFHTHHNALDMPLFLRIAPELYLKRLLVGGFDRVYEMGRQFRNEGISTRHNPEFTMLEFYQAYATYEDLMDLMEEMLRSVDAAVLKEYPHYADERPFSFQTAWKRVTMRQSILDRLSASGSNPEIPSSPFDGLLVESVLNDADALEALCAEKLPELAPGDRKAFAKASSHGSRIYVLYEVLVEPVLPQLYRTEDGSFSVPVFITEYPFEISPLSRRNDETPQWVDRFELFVEGRELANAFSELNDPEDQAGRFEDQLSARESGDEEAMQYDADYIRALSYGMPPAAGLGLGIDRLVMLICNRSSIRDVLLFPLLRPEAG